MLTIASNNGNQGNFENAINFAIRVLEASPALIKPCSTGKDAATELVALADGILEYITKSRPKT